MRGQSRDYPTFPETEETLGYNPARFLDSTIEWTDYTTDLTAKALIRGIDNIETIRAWIAVEVDLGRADGSPRREIITQLNRRQAQLENDAAPVDGATADEPTEPTESEPASQTTAPAKTDKRDEPAELSEPYKPSQLSQPDAAPTEEEPVPDPTCPVCGEDLVPEEIAGQRGYWCCECREFREPASDPPSPSRPSPSADDDRANASDITPEETSTTATAVATDGGAPDPDTPPRCPDCHGELPTETVGGDDDDAHWCDYCGRVVRVEVAV